MVEVLVDPRCVVYDWSNIGEEFEKTFILSLAMRAWFIEHDIETPSVMYMPKNGRWSKREKASLLFASAEDAMMFKLKWVPEDYLE